MNDTLTNTIHAFPQVLNNYQGLAAFISVITTIVGFIFVKLQIRQAQKSFLHTEKALIQSGNTAIYGLSSQFYLFLADKANNDLRPFFYDNKKFDPERDHAVKNQIYALCEYLVDLFEYITVQGNGLDEKITKTWEAYFEFISSHSSAFRDYFKAHEFYYSEEFKSKFRSTLESGDIRIREEYESLNEVADKVNFVAKLYEVKGQLCSSVDSIELIQIAKNEDNGIIAHDIVFLVGFLQRQSASEDSEVQVSELISIFEGTSSIVLRHEIIESLSNFKCRKARDFLSDQTENENLDISQTARIALIKGPHTTR